MVSFCNLKMRRSISFFILAVFFGCATHSSDPVVAERNFWTKEAYDRAEARLKRSKTGMTFDEFTTLIDMKLMLSGSKVVAVFADGWLRPGTETWASGQTKINEQLFGYVEGITVINKAVARFENEKLVSIRFLDNKGLSEYSAEERKAFTTVGVEHFYSRDAYVKAAERAKGLKLGMDVHEFGEVMNLVIVVGKDNSFSIVAEGLLGDLGEQSKPDPTGPHRLKKLYFGYRNGNQSIPKIAIEFRDGKVSAINWL